MPAKYKISGLFFVFHYFFRELQCKCTTCFKPENYHFIISHEIYFIPTVIQILHSLVILVVMSSSIKRYFERKKRDLSDKATNEEERKKPESKVWICC